MEDRKIQAKEKRKGGKGVLVGLMAGAGLLGVSYLGLCAWVYTSSEILEHVTVAGIPVGRMSQSQARRTLERAILPGEEDLTLSLSYGPWNGTLSGTAVEFDSFATAKKAWETGREHFLLQGASFLAHLFGKEEDILPEMSWSASGRSQAAQLIDEADAKINELNQGVYQIQEDQMVLTKGVIDIHVDRDRAEDMMLDAMGEALANRLSGEGETKDQLQLPANQIPTAKPDFQAIHKEVARQPQDAHMDPETKEIVEHEVGLDFDVHQAETLYHQAKEGETVVIPLQITQPKETTESFEEKLFRDLLGEGTSRVAGTANRKYNVQLSAQACDNVILMPGEVFSYNDTTGSRTAAKGYLPAPAYVGGLSVDEVGGGICQTSSTIYYATLHTTLEVVERSPHRYAVGYVPDGMDATVYYGSLDFRFRNNTNYPIKIVTESYDKDGSRYLNVKIYGTNETGYYAVPERVQFDHVAPTTQYVADPTIPRGTTKVDDKQNAYSGKKASTSRSIYDQDGNLVETQDMGVSNYRMRPTTILYNPADGDPSTWVNGKPPKPKPPQQPPAPPPETAPSREPSEGSDPQNAPNTAPSSQSRGSSLLEVEER